MEYPDTYQLLVLKGHPAIKCLMCGSVSYNKNDIEQRWCGQCTLYHDDIWPPCKESAIKFPRVEEPGDVDRLTIPDRPQL